MPRTKKSDAPLAKSEVRHKKQKEKLEQKGNKVESTSSYIPVKNFKITVCEEAQKSGLKCQLNVDTVLMFEEEDHDKINNWLKNYFKEYEAIPMSYGFCKSISKGESNEQEK